VLAAGANRRTKVLTPSPFSHRRGSVAEWRPMTTAEFKLACVLVTVFAIYTFILKQDLRRNAVVFILACAAGFAVQLSLGAELNLYTPNISAYVSYVSLAVIVTWGIGLTSVYSLHLWAARALRIPPGAILFFFCCVPVIVVLEFTGSNLLRMKLHNFTDYAPLMPQLNAMHAPPWLYGYYGIIQFLFYGLLKALGIEKAGTDRLVVREPAGSFEQMGSDS
jgi:hypothetical protein